MHAITPLPFIERKTRPIEDLEWEWRMHQGKSPAAQERLRSELSRCCTKAETVLRIARLKISKAEGDYPTIAAAVKEVRDFRNDVFPRIHVIIDSFKDKRGMVDTVRSTVEMYVIYLGKFSRVKERHRLIKELQRPKEFFDLTYLLKERTLSYITNYDDLKSVSAVCFQWNGFTRMRLTKVHLYRIIFQMQVIFDGLPLNGTQAELDDGLRRMRRNIRNKQEFFYKEDMQEPLHKLLDKALSEVDKVKTISRLFLMIPLEFRAFYHQLLQRVLIRIKRSNGAVHL